MNSSDQRLTANFQLSEFLRSETATRRGIDNSPDDQSLRNIREHLAPGMQRIRDLLNETHRAQGGASDIYITVSSGYRGLALNSAIGGSTKSQHMLGLAADFTAPRFGTPLEICRLLHQYKERIRFDQLIHEGSWTHVSFTGAPRLSILTAHFENGRVRYTEGLTA
jgi:hypothetical protein